MAAISFLALEISKSFSGILKTAGDNQWMFYGQLVSQYLVLIPITYLGVITPLGVVAIFLAMIAETGARAAITGRRFVSGNWKVVSRAYYPDTESD